MNKDPSHIRPGVSIEGPPGSPVAPGPGDNSGDPGSYREVPKRRGSAGAAPDCGGGGAAKARPLPRIAAPAGGDAAAPAAPPLRCACAATGLCAAGPSGTGAAAPATRAATAATAGSGRPKVRSAAGISTAAAAAAAAAPPACSTAAASSDVAEPYLEPEKVHQKFQQAYAGLLF